MKVFTVSTLCAAALGLIVTAAKEFEGQFWPVVADVTFRTVHPVDRLTARIGGTFRKVRSCDFDHIEFRLLAGDAYSIVEVRFEEPAQVRFPGLETFGPWLIDMSAEQFSAASMAIVFHRCHPFWLTQTIFKPAA